MPPKYEMANTRKRAMEIQQVYSGGWHRDTSRDLTHLYWKRTASKGIDKLRRELEVKASFWLIQHRGEPFEGCQERGDNVKKGIGGKNTFSMSVVVNFLTTDSSQGNESSYLELIWHAWQSFLRDVCRDTTWTSTVSSLKFTPAVIQTGKAQQWLIWWFPVTAWNHIVDQYDLTVTLCLHCFLYRPVSSLFWLQGVQRNN